MPSSCWARRTSRPADTPRPSRRWNATWPTNPDGDVAEFALADLVAAQLGAGRSARMPTRRCETLARQFPDGKALPRARLRVAEAALAARQYDRAAEQFRLVTGPAQAAARLGRASIAAHRSASGALAGLGQALEGLGRPAEAAAAFGAVAGPGPRRSRSRRRWRWPGPVRSRPRTGPTTRSPPMRTPPSRFAGRDEGPRAALARARLLAKLGRHEPAAEEYERLLDDAPRCAMPSPKIGATPDALLAELGWSLVDASKSAEADRVFARLLKDYPVEPSCGRRAVQPGGIGQPGAQLRGSDPPARAPGRREAARTVAIARTVDPSRPSLAIRRPAHAGRPVPAGTDPGRVAGLAGRRVDPRPAARASSPRIPIAARPGFLRAEAALQLGDAAAAESGFAALLAEPAPRRAIPPGFRRSVRLEQIRCWVALKRWKDVVPAVQELRGELKPDDPALAELDYAIGQAQMGLAGWKRRARRSRP